MKRPVHKKLTRRQLRRQARLRRNILLTAITALAGTLLCATTVGPAVATADTADPGQHPAVAVARTIPSAASRSAWRDRIADPAVETTSVLVEGEWSLGTSSTIDTSQLDSKKENRQDSKTASIQTDNTARQQADSHTSQPVQDRETIEEATPQDVTDTSTPTASGDTGNAYPWGQCTWWAYIRRHQLDLPVGSFFGNGWQWASSAASLGYTVDNTPTVGAVIVFSPGQAGANAYYGHVGIVEQVHDDGSITISESNAQGLGVISNRTLGSPGSYRYIH